MASPQLEDGYTRIANELLEAIAYAQFTARQIDVLLIVMRKTYGFGKSEAAISVNELSRMTGISVANISRTVNDLVSMGVLKICGIEGQTRVIKLNKHYDGWQNTCQHGKACQVSKSSTCQVSKSRLANPASDTIQRKIKKRERKRSPEFLALWALYPAKKRHGLDFVTEEDEQAVIDNAEAVRGALEQYLRETDEKYICKAETFFREKWRAYAEDADTQTKKVCYGRKLE